MGASCKTEIGRPEPPCCLFYFTEGKGNQDVIVHQQQAFEETLPQDQRQFEFQLPAIPWSFSGKLIRVRWALELIVKAKPKDESLRHHLVVSPTSKEIGLYEHGVEGFR